MAQKEKSSDIAIVLVSGGMDSLCVAAIAHKRHKQVAYLHLNYGQRTQKKELESFKKIASHYQVPSSMQKIVDMTFLKQIGGSSLTDLSLDVEQNSSPLSSEEEKDSLIPSSYVPFRNTHIIAMAVSWAEILGAKKIYIGANFEDSPGYPDCRPDYYHAYNELIRLGTKEGNIQIETPVLFMKKSEIVLKCFELNAPLELTWSCYTDEKIACGTCDSCVLRLRGFKEANKTDPLPYQTSPLSSFNSNIS